MAELHFGDFRFDTRGLTLEGPAGGVEIRAKTRDLLLYLIANRGRFVGRRELLQSVWGDASTSEASLNQAISELRRLLGDSATEPRYVETRTKAGYRFVAPLAHQPTRTVEAVPVRSPSPSGEPPGPGPGRVVGRRAWVGGAVAVLVLAVAGALWLARTPGPPALLVRDPAGEDGAEVTAALVKALAGKVPASLAGVQGLRVVRSEGPPREVARASWELELRCRTVHGVRVEAEARLCRRRDGQVVWGWSFVAPAELAGVGELAARVTAAVRRTVTEKVAVSP